MTDHNEVTFETELYDFLSQVINYGQTDLEAQAAYGELVKQLFGGETKRADYFHSLITLVYAEAARAGDAG